MCAPFGGNRRKRTTRLKYGTTPGDAVGILSGAVSEACCMVVLICFDSLFQTERLPEQFDGIALLG